MGNREKVLKIFLRGILILRVEIFFRVEIFLRDR
jgi:hypothetical protein